MPSSLIWYSSFLMPPIKSSASKHYALLMVLILSIGEIMPSCSRCIKKGLIYITIVAPFGHKLLSALADFKRHSQESAHIMAAQNAALARVQYLTQVHTKVHSKELHLTKQSLCKLKEEEAKMGSRQVEG